MKFPPIPVFNLPMLALWSRRDQTLSNSAIRCFCIHFSGGPIQTLKIHYFWIQQFNPHYRVGRVVMEQLLPTFKYRRAIQQTRADFGSGFRADFRAFFVLWNQERNYSSKNGPKSGPKCPKQEVYACTLFKWHFGQAYFGAIFGAKSSIEFL